MARYVELDALVAEIERRKEWWFGSSIEAKYKKEECDDILSLIDILQEEPVSDELEEAAERLSTIYAGEGSVDPKREGFAFYIGFKNGAKWKNENLWKPADGDDLPEIDREVIALFDNGKVGFAYRPNPDGWDAKSIITEKVEHYTPKTFDKGGWNIPDIKWWLDVELPKEIEL